MSNFERISRCSIIFSDEGGGGMVDVSWDSTFKRWLIPVSQAGNMSSGMLEILDAWCKSNERAARILELFFMGGDMWDDQFISDDDLRIVIDSDIACQEEKDSANQALLSRRGVMFRKDLHISERTPDEPTLTTRRKKMKGPGYVYLIRSGPRHKIGISSNLDRRILALQKQSPFELELVHAIKTDDMISLELQLHEHFASKRTRGEWFDLDDADITWIKSRGVQDGLSI